MIGLGPLFGIGPLGIDFLFGGGLVITVDRDLAEAQFQARATQARADREPQPTEDTSIVDAEWRDVPPALLALPAPKAD